MPEKTRSEERMVKEICCNCSYAIPPKAKRLFVCKAGRINEVNREYNVCPYKLRRYVA